MQDGSVTVERRKRGPDVWCFRWREGGPDGRKIHRRIVLGTADDLKSIASARRAVVGLRREINVNDVRIRRESIKLTDLSRHFQQRELADRNPRIAYSTKKAYAGYLEKWIEPRWGEYLLPDIRAVEVESWLKSLNRSPGTRCKMRNVMSLLFNHGRRHDLCDRNPIQWVRQSAKRRSAPDILTSSEVQELLANLRFRERTLVLLAVTTGLPEQADLCNTLHRAERYWHLQDGEFSETRASSQQFARGPARMASPDAVSIIRELGVCKSRESGALALLGAANHAPPYPSCCAKIRHHETIRLAHLSAYVFHTAWIYWCRAEDHARAAAPLDDSRNARYVHAGGHNREAQCAGGRGRAFVPRKKARNASPAWLNSITCTYFVPFCAHEKMKQFR